MSFAFNAAPFNNNNEEITSNSSSIDRKGMLKIRQESLDEKIHLQCRT